MLTRLQKLNLAPALLALLAGGGAFAQEIGGPAPFSSDADLCSVYGSSAEYAEVMIDAGVDGDVAYRNITAGGCPNHWNACQKPYCSMAFQAEATVFEKILQIPSYPRFYPNNATNDQTCSVGSIAIALNGVSIFSQSDGTPECGDAIASEATTFDACGAHAEPSGEYHYHNVPQCLLAALNETDTTHSPQIGWSYDGFPIYGPFGPGGVMMYPCDNDNANATYCLDDCNGYYGALADTDEYLYRYYFSGERGDMTCSATVTNGARTDCDFDATEGTSDVEPCCTSAVPSTDFSPYVIGCYVGCTYQEMVDGDCDGGDAGYTFTEASAVEGVVEIFLLDGFDYSGLTDEDLTGSSDGDSGVLRNVVGAHHLGLVALCVAAVAWRT